MPSSDSLSIEAVGVNVGASAAVATIDPEGSVTVASRFSWRGLARTHKTIAKRIISVECIVIFDMFLQCLIEVKEMLVAVGDLDLEIVCALDQEDLAFILAKYNVATGAAKPAL